MAKTSAGICLWRAGATHLVEVLVAHPGGPFWSKKDEGAWSLPKGEFDPTTEDGFAAACREFVEELGHQPPDSVPFELGTTTLKSGKVITAWALEGTLDPATINSNLFEMEWPPRSGRRQQFPEIDRVLWCSPDIARTKLNPAQAVFIDRLVEHVATR